MQNDLSLASKLFNLAVTGDPNNEDVDRLADGSAEFKAHTVANLHHAAIVAALTAGANPATLIERYAKHVMQVIQFADDADAEAQAIIDNSVEVI